MTGRAMRNMVRLLVAITLAVCGICIEPETTASAPRGDIVMAYTYDDRPSGAVLARATVERGPSTTHDRNVYDAVDRWSRGAPARPGEAAPAATTYGTHSRLGLVERMTPTTWDGVPGLEEGLAAFDVAGVAANTGQAWAYRGVGRNHPGYDDALKGRASPRNPNGPATPEMHNRGNTTDSPYTSWTRDPEIARMHAGPDGAIIRVPRGEGSPFKFEWSPDIYFEQEILIRGPVRGAELWR